MLCIKIYAKWCEQKVRGVVLRIYTSYNGSGVEKISVIITIYIVVNVAPSSDSPGVNPGFSC